MDLSFLSLQFLNGMAFAMTLFLVAVGLTLIFGLMDVMKTITFKGPRGTFKLDPQTQNIILTVYIFEIVQEGGNVVPRVSKVLTNWKDPGVTK